MIHASDVLRFFAVSKKWKKRHLTLAAFDDGGGFALEQRNAAGGPPLQCFKVGEGALVARLGAVDASGRALTSLGMTPPADAMRS